GLLLEDVFRVDDRLGAIVRLPAHRPRKVLGIVPLRRARGEEELRYLPVVEVFAERRVVGGAEALEDEGDAVLLDQAADLLQRLGWAVAVVEADEIDLA